MNVIKKGKAIVREERGFSLVEALLAMGITLIVLSAAFGAFKSMTDLGFSATQASESNHDIQTALNLIRTDLQRVRDDAFFQNAGWGNANRCFDPAERNFPPCPNANNSLEGLRLLAAGTNVGGVTRIDAVKPGTVNGSSAISILYNRDSFAGDIFVIVSRTGGSIARIAPDPAAPDAARNNILFSAIQTGDFVFLGDILQIVTAADLINGTRDFGTDDIGTGVNFDFDGIAGGGGAASFPAQARLIRRVTYYREGNWLMRQINARPASQLIPGVTQFDLSYDIFAGGGLVTVPANTIATNQRDIRMVRVTISAQGEDSLPNGELIENTITTEMAVRITNQ